MRGPMRLTPLAAAVTLLVATGCNLGGGSPSGDAVIDAFLGKVTRDDFTFHAVQEGTIEVRGENDEETVEISAEMDVSGEDAVGEVTFDVGAEITIDVLLVDGEGYTQGPGGDWETIPGFAEQPQTPVNPFVRLESAEDLEYVERTDDGLHHLTTDVWMGGDAESLESQGWEDVEFSDHSADIYVTDDGTPVRMEFEGNATGDYRGDPAEVHFDVDYEFSDVGQPVEIPEP